MPHQINRTDFMNRTFCNAQGLVCAIV